MYKIYKLTFPNGKIYIGQTSQELKNRWDSGRGYKENEALFHDILLYGWLNVKKEMLEEVEDKETALEREAYYIEKHNSGNAEYGYNHHQNISRLKDKIYNYVRCVETGDIYESQAAAAEAFNVTRAAINYAIKNNSRCKRYHWEIVEMTKAEYNNSKNLT